MTIIYLEEMKAFTRSSLTHSSACMIKLSGTGKLPLKSVHKKSLHFLPLLDCGSGRFYRLGSHHFPAVDWDIHTRTPLEDDCPLFGHNESDSPWLWSSHPMIGGGVGKIWNSNHLSVRCNKYLVHIAGAQAVSTYMMFAWILPASIIDQEGTRFVKLVFAPTVVGVFR